MAIVWKQKQSVYGHRFAVWVSNFIIRCTDVYKRQTVSSQRFNYLKNVLSLYQICNSALWRVIKVWSFLVKDIIERFVIITLNKFFTFL